jgi:arginyl-tRNA synthetase
MRKYVKLRALIIQKTVTGERMKYKCIDDLYKQLTAEETVEFQIQVELCPSDMPGDITVNCFRFAKLLKKNPMELAQNVSLILKEHPDVEEVECIKAFVNVILKAEAIHRDTVADIDNFLNYVKLKETKKYLIEYSAPNTNKPQHLGHVRNNTLGMSLVSLLRRVGHKVTAINLVNDRGIHICKSMVAYQRFGNGITPKEAGIKGDHLVGNFYVKYNDELKTQLESLRQNNEELSELSDDDLFLKTEIGQAAQKMLQDWENGNKEVKELWLLMNSWVFEGFDVTYKRMGIEFDQTYLESETYLLGKDIIDKGIKEGIFEKREDGAVIAKLGKKLGEKVVLRSDGTSVYITQDIGTTVKKYEDYQPDSQVWVVGDEQKYHFQVLFEILKKLGYKWAENLNHLAYGMVNLPTGKMKSREGTVVDADDLFDEMHSLAKTATLERAGDNVPDDLEMRSEIIGMGALKFMLLKFNPKTTIMFDPEASMKFEGDTGPYVQYASARISSMLRKAGNQYKDTEINWSLLNSPFEKNISTRISQYPDIMQRAAELMDCSIVVAYLLDLAKDFSRFYRECPVLIAETEELKNARLALSEKVQIILKDGLKALTIKVPEAM